MGGGGGPGGTGAMKAVFLLILSLNLQANADEDFVHQWCKRSWGNDLCVSIVDADPRSDLKNTPQGMCSILRDRAVVEVSAAKKKVIHILNNNKKNHTFNHYGVQCLQFSTRQYDDMLYDLDVFDLKFSVINGTTHSDGLHRMGRIINNAWGCEECFTERPGTTPSPMTSQNNNIQDICAVISSILNLLYCNNAKSCEQ